MGPLPVSGVRVEGLGVVPWTVTFVVIRVTRELLVRTVDDCVVTDEWGMPYQKSLWAAVSAEVDPHRGQVNGVALDAGMRAKVADVSEAAARANTDLYPPNPIAWTMLTVLGHPARRWFGTIAIVGTEDERGITGSLTTDQLDLVTRAYRQALAPRR